MTQSRPAARQTALLEQLSVLPDYHERLAWLTQRARRHSTLPEFAKIDANLVPGCVSQVWLWRNWEQERCRFASEADSPLVLALVGVVCEIFDNCSPAEIANCPFTLLQDAGILRNLTPTRQNGLAAVEKAVRTFAANPPP